MQPTFLPWPGYFAQINYSDKFIFYNTAQYVKSSWHNRNIIFSNNNPIFLTVPVAKGRLSKSIEETMLSNFDFHKRKIIFKILNSYPNSKFKNDLIDITNYLKNINTKYLGLLNIELIKYISFKIKLSTEFIELNNKSDFFISKDRNNKLLEILEKNNSNEYLCGPTGYTYINKNEFIQKKITPFILIHKELLPVNFSIVDLISKIGYISCKSYLEDQFTINKL